MTTFPARPGIALLLTALLLLGGCACPARADESRQSGTPETDASRLVEEVLRKAGGEGKDSLGEWTRSILDRALDRAGETARRTVPARPGDPVPLPAERHAAGLAAGRPASAEVLIFASLSVPAASWRQWAHDAARTGAPLVMRGVGKGGLAGTAKRIGARLGRLEAGPGSGPGQAPGSGSPGSGPGQAGAGVAIDPRLFRLFGIDRVPAVVVVPGGVPPCESRGCSGDPAPPHDLIAGNIGLVAALEAIAAEGDAGREIAKAYLERLTEDGR